MTKRQRSALPAILRKTLRNRKTKKIQLAQKTERTQMSQTKRAIRRWRKWRLKLLKSKAFQNSQNSTREASQTAKKEKNGEKSLSNYKEIPIEAKQDARLIKSRLLKRDSQDANDAVDKLYGLIACLTAQLASVKGKLMVYKKLQGPATVEKAENSYTHVSHIITGLKNNRKIKISKRPLEVTIRPSSYRPN